LGPESRQIIGLFLRRGMLPVLVGAAAGVCVTLVAGRVMSSLVYGVATSDAAAIGGAVVTFTLVALAAILIATRGAARTDPMVVLRAE
jgi:ABC-type antimicrobial peptide transport system permease subunit